MDAIFYKLDLNFISGPELCGHRNMVKSFIGDRRFMIMEVYSTANLRYAKCDMTYERGNTSEIFYEQFVIKTAKSYFR